MSKETKYQSNSLLRGLRILEAFGSGHSQMTLSQIADEISVTSSAAFRCVRTLEQEGYLIRDESARTFRLASRVMDLGYSYIKSLDLGEVATRQARALRDQSGFSVHVAVLEETETVYVYRAISSSPMVSNVPVGSRLPAFATAMGRIMLAQLGENELDHRFGGYTFPKYTEATIETLDQLKAALAEDRERGYVAQPSQLAEGTVVIAAPIRDRSGHVVGAINMSGHRSQFKATKKQVKMVCDCAERISRMQ